MSGISIVLLAALCFCAQNVTVRILFNTSSVFGWEGVGGFVEPSLANSFLLLALRMVWVVPVLSVVSLRLYPPLWGAIAQLRHPQHRRLRGKAIAGGGLMFLYLALLYISIGLIPTGIALILFFLYPLFTLILTTILGQQAPTPVQLAVMVMMLTGTALTLSPSGMNAVPHQGLGMICGVAAGLAYAGYTLVGQQSFQELHPIPFTWLSFAITLLLAALFLPFTLDLPPDVHWLGLWVGSLISALATLIGHVLQNLGIRQIGANQTALIGSSNPTLTLILAWVAIGESLTWIQVLGVVVVTLGIIILRHRDMAAIAKQ
ncbi:DMT family transporter [Spirulina major CS-329]|uniref:DMT family transporter n=1 Tax=Spirulina TaxID=1154 RepID=UPI00232B5786|nr:MULTISPECIES: DMT family transporter [Spirulina]MDB9494484.1 DMT family transporter [Spirulina subsalsa CS-330]MDB9503312.1 DMT family transporter [Spirulina major CS-329]